VKLLRNLDLYIEGDGSHTDHHLNQIMRIFPSLYHIDVTGTMFKFTCLQEEFFNKNVKSVNLPWPQANDYSVVMNQFLKQNRGLEKLTIMARDDTMIKLLCDTQSTSLTWLAILLGEGVTGGGLLHILQSCTKIDHLYLRVDDDTIFTEQVFLALSALPDLVRVQISNRKTIFGKVRISHPTVKYVYLVELRVEEIEIDCPKAEVIPPTKISNGECAKKIYGQFFPGKVVVRVSYGNDTWTFDVSATETVEQLLKRVRRKFRNDTVSYLTSNFKKLGLDEICSKKLENGCLLHAM